MINNFKFLIQTTAYNFQMKMNREMFDGKDYPTQWALNPSMYQNMSNDQGIKLFNLSIINKRFNLI